MHVFITGGNGFIGSTVARQLYEAGHRVRCLVRGTSDCSRLDGITWQRVDGDVRDAAVVERGMAGCDAAIHMAGPTAWRIINSPTMRDIVRGGTRNMLEAARRRPGLPMVFVSSVAAINGTQRPEVANESTPFSLFRSNLNYSLAKHEAESMCIDAARDGQPVTIVNPAEVYGPRSLAMITAGNLVDFAKSNPVLVCDGGTSIVHVEDVALGIVRSVGPRRSWRALHPGR